MKCWPFGQWTVDLIYERKASNSVLSCTNSSRRLTRSGIKLAVTACRISRSMIKIRALSVHCLQQCIKNWQNRPFKWQNLSAFVEDRSWLFISVKTLQNALFAEHWKKISAYFILFLERNSILAVTALIQQSAAIIYIYNTCVYTALNSTLTLLFHLYVHMFSH